MELNDTISGSRLKGIFELLAKQEQMLVEMRQMLDEEQKALSASDLKELIAIGKRKEQQLLRIRRAEDVLQDSAREALKASNDKIVKLDDLRPLATEQEAAMLVKQKDQLEKMRDEIVERNMMNKKFAHEILGFLNDAIHMITGAVEEHSVYSQKGAAKAVANGPSFISKEV